MRDSLFVESRAPSARVVSQRPVLKRWINGLQCCEKPCRKTTSGWKRFWPRWNNTKKGKHDEQDDAEHRRRYTRGGEKAVRRASGGCVPGAHGPEINPEMVAGS